jgi:Ca-activated chloride channel family protein
MSWANPSAVWLFAVLGVLVAFAVDRHRRGIALWSAVFSPSIWPRLLPGWNPGARIRKLLLWSAGMVLLVAALARPQWGAREETVTSTGLDLMVVLDLSRSMDVEDVVPSRIKKARHFIRGLLARLQGDRVGVVAFAASSYVASPLTNDLNYVQEVVEVLSPGTLGNQGTDIGLGLETALASLERGAEDSLPSRAILLITDGEDHEGEARRMAVRFKEKDIRIFVLGVGSAKGGPIPVRDDEGQLQGYKRVGQEVVLSRLESSTLEKVAEASGGRYWTATDSEGEMDDLLRELGAMDRSRLAERKIIIPHERFQIFVALGLILILAEWWLPLVRGSGSAALLFVLALHPLSSEAGTIDGYLRNREGLKAFAEKDAETAKKRFAEAQALDPDHVEPLFNQGVAELQGGASEQATRTFEKALQQSKLAGDPDRAGQSLYNLGAALEQGKQPGPAIRAFAEAIRMALLSGDSALEQDARKRIEALQQQKQQQDQQQQQQQQKQDQSKDSQGQQKQDQGQGQGEPQQGGSPNEQQQEPKNFEDPSVSRRRVFRSEKLTPEDSERVMSELSAREKELQARLKKQRGKRTAQGGKDW